MRDVVSGLALALALSEYFPNLVSPGWTQKWTLIVVASPSFLSLLCSASFFLARGSVEWESFVCSDSTCVRCQKKIQLFYFRATGSSLSMTTTTKESGDAGEAQTNIAAPNNETQGRMNTYERRRRKSSWILRDTVAPTSSSHETFAGRIDYGDDSMESSYYLLCRVHTTHHFVPSAVRSRACIRATVCAPSTSFKSSSDCSALI